MAQALPSAYRMTYADWLKMPDDGRLYEVLEGELFVTPPPSIEHQRIARDIGFRIYDHLRRSAQGEVLFAPVGVRLGEDVLEPDVVMVLASHRQRIGEQAIEGAPDLVVEVLSPGSAKRDVGVKQRRYEAAGVPEYWIVDPVSRCISVLLLQEGRFVDGGTYREGDALVCSVLSDFELQVGSVFPTR